MATIAITQQELLDALSDAAVGSGPKEARTVAELCSDTQSSELRVRRGLKLLQVQGRLRVHRVSRPSLDGRVSVVPAYTVLPPQRKAAKR